MKIIEVKKDKKLQREFLELPSKLYKDDPKWVRPLDNEVEAVFDPEKNPFFKHGQCTRWILQNGTNETIGRVAAFIDENNVHTDNLQATGGMGFFECIKDEKAAFTLFDTCKTWLEERGMQAMDGPINFGERNKWWGLLVEGFHRQSYNIPYHKKYYKNLFENYGFRDYFQQYTYIRQLRGGLKHESIQRRVERIAKKEGYHFEHVNSKELSKYMEDFRNIFNTAWAGSSKNFSEMTKEEAQAIFKEMKPIFDERLLWFGYFEDEPIAFFIMIPDINQTLRYLNGKLNLIGKLKFVYYKWKVKCDNILALVFGVVPKFQRRGVEAAIAYAFSNYADNSPDLPYQTIELNWIGDFNPRMMKFTEMMGFDVHRIHITYRKLFDDNLPFQRAPQRR